MSENELKGSDLYNSLKKTDPEEFVKCFKTPGWKSKIREDLSYGKQKADYKQKFDYDLVYVKFRRWLLSLDANTLYSELSDIILTSENEYFFNEILNGGGKVVKPTATFKDNLKKKLGELKYEELRLLDAKKHLKRAKDNLNKEMKSSDPWLAPMAKDLVKGYEGKVNSLEERIRYLKTEQNPEKDIVLSKQEDSTPKKTELHDNDSNKTSDIQEFKRDANNHKATTVGKVIGGRYEGYRIITAWIDQYSESYPLGVLFGILDSTNNGPILLDISTFAHNFGREHPFSDRMIQQYELISSSERANKTSAVKRSLLGGFLFGYYGLSAGFTAKKEMIYTLRITLGDGSISIVELNEEGYRIFITCQ